jgi:hypothetical protein
MPILGIIASAIRKVVTDTFTRTTTGNLGTSTSGALWSAIRGTWFANGSAAQSDGTATDYPIATVDVGQNVTASASVSPGTGIAFWVTDQNSWWASTAVSTSTSCNCGTCYDSCYCASCGSCRDCAYVDTTCASYGTCSGTYGSGAVSGTTMGNGDTGGCYKLSTGAYLGPRSCSRYNQVYQCGSYYSCPGTYSCNPHSCNCSTCNSYQLRLLKSEGGTISTATGDVSLTSAAAALALTVSGNDITAIAYSDTAKTTSLGTLTYTATSPTKGIKVGVIKSPASLDQGSTVDDFSAKL